MTRTDEEILAKVKDVENSDVFGVIRTDLLSRLPFEEAKSFLEVDMTEESYQPLNRDADSLLEEMHKYMEFAWTKANHARGLSAGRSIDHYYAWLWLLGEDEAAEGILDYRYYGKPQLRAICERYGWDWKTWDDGVWRNSSIFESGESASSIPNLELSWKS